MISIFGGEAPRTRRARGWRPGGLAALLWASAGLGIATPAPAEEAAPPTPPRPQEILAGALAGDALERYERVALTIYRDESDTPALSRALELYVSPSLDGPRIFGTVVGSAIRRGTSFLVLPSASGDGPIAPSQYFAYLPQTGRVRRLSGGQRADAFFGSHLSLADFERHPASHFAALGATRATIDPGSRSAESVYRLEIEPRFDAGYDRAVLWVATEDLALLRTEQLRDGSAEPIRTIEARREWLDPFERSLLPRKSVVRSLEEGRTEIEVVERTTSIEIPDSTFTPSHMRRKAR